MLRSHSNEENGEALEMSNRPHLNHQYSPPLQLKPFVDVITTPPRLSAAKLKKIGVVEITHPPDAEVAEKDATDQLIVSILPHAHTEKTL